MRKRSWVEENSEEPIAQPGCSAIFTSQKQLMLRSILIAKSRCDLELHIANTMIFVNDNIQLIKLSERIFIIENVLISCQYYMILLILLAFVVD